MLNNFLLKKIMNLIKLDEIDSTNNYLKQLNKEKYLENFTTIFAENQTHGKGQMGNKWITEKGKNLTFSTLITTTKNHIDLNMMISVSIIEILEKNNINQLAIKWPNDIILKNKKIGGVLIEQSKNIDHQNSFIIGIGLNIHQKDFKNMPNASSLELLTQKKWDKTILLIEIVNQIKLNFNKNIFFKTLYLKYLYQLNEICKFKIKEQLQNGKIIDVSDDGQLIVSIDNQNQSFGIKEIEMIY
jgi:BirA family biotin operon repressor/biotin-[acetyl-CoA-carboxylase] ligase